MKKAVDDIKTPKVGEIVEGKIVGKGKASVFLDLENIGTGIIYGREFYNAKNELKKLDIGQSVFAKVLELDNDEGYLELSLAGASKEIAWKDLIEKREKDQAFIVKIIGANKGGLLAEVSGVPAFLPSSQLSPANYPKIDDGDNQKILKSLQKLVGTELEVKIFDLDPRENKLILSERAKENEKIKEILKAYKVGDIIEGEIVGVVDFGAFIKFPLNTENAIEGLIHISELDWQLIEDPAEVIKVKDNVKAKIIDILNDKVSLSLKALKQDPWQDITYKKGDILKGKVTKFNPFGAFVRLDSKIQGLCHVSELNSEKKMEDALKIGEEYNFQILSIEPKDHRMSLKLIENPAK